MRKFANVALFLVMVSGCMACAVVSTEQIDGEVAPVIVEPVPADTPAPNHLVTEIQESEQTERQRLDLQRQQMVIEATAQAHTQAASIQATAQAVTIQATATAQAMQHELSMQQAKSDQWSVVAFGVIAVMLMFAVGFVVHLWLNRKPIQRAEIVPVQRPHDGMTPREFAAFAAGWAEAKGGRDWEVEQDDDGLLWGVVRSGEKQREYKLLGGG